VENITINVTVVMWGVTNMDSDRDEVYSKNVLTSIAWALRREIAARRYIKHTYTHLQVPKPVPSQQTYFSFPPGFLLSSGLTGQSFPITK